MPKPPRHDFGKRPRQPAALPLPDMPQAKRSNHVALLVMGTLAVGGGAYALMPRQNCQPQPAPGVTAPAAPGMAQPATAPQGAVACSPRGSSSSGGGGSGYSRTHLSFFGGGSSYGSSASSAAAAPSSSSSGVTRGGFGSFGHAFGGFSSGS